MRKMFKGMKRKSKAVGRVNGRFEKYGRKEKEEKEGLTE